MPRQHGPSVLSDLRVLFEGGLVAGLSDAELLERYAARAIANATSEAAFAVLVDRHGPMVWGVCREILGDVHDAEDAFQATFLVVARQAQRVPESGALGRWIYGIARRVASRARAEARRRRAMGAILKPSVSGEAEREAVRAEFGAVVGEEVARLPARYRAAVELCFLRGMTNEAAARELGWPVGTVKSRLARARERLRGRLAARGLAPAVVAGAAALQGAHAAPPAALVRATVWAVRSVTTAAASGTFPESVTVLAMGVVRAMFMKKVMQSVAAVAAMLAVGAGAYAFQDTGRRGSASTTERSGFGPGEAISGEFRNPEAYADERADSIANLVERLARRAAELQGRKRYAEAHAVVRELTDVVDQWEGRLRAERAPEQPTDAGGSAGSAPSTGTYKNHLFSTGKGASTGGRAAAPVVVEPRPPVPDQPPAPAPVNVAPRPPVPVNVEPGPLVAPAPVAHHAESRPPVPDSVEQRLGRVEQQLGEILKRLDRPADGERLPTGLRQR